MMSDQEASAAMMMAVWLAIFAVMVICLAVGKWRERRLKKWVEDQMRADAAARRRGEDDRGLARFPWVDPLPEGMTRKGGRNVGPPSFDRPPPPKPLSPPDPDSLRARLDGLS